MISLHSGLKGNMDQKYPELANTLEEVRKGKFLEDLPGGSSFPSTSQIFS